MAVTLLTPTAYARHRGCDEKAVRKAVAANRISTINGLIDAAVADIQWTQNTRARGDSRRPVADAPLTVPIASVPPPTPSSSGYDFDRARRERYEADLAEIKLREQQGDLVRVAEVRAEIAKHVGELRQRLMQVTARLAHVLTAEARIALDAELRDVLSNVTTPPITS